METDKHLSLEEIKSLQIEMLKYFDRFCRDNNITYFLSYGTLLGAIRHKGYIPWDDDVDVMVPRDEIDHLKAIFPKNGRYKVADIENQPNYEFPFPRLIDTMTYSKLGKKAISYGINIDIYIIDGAPADNLKRKEWIKKIKKIRKKRLFIIRFRNKLFRLFPITSFPLIKYYTRLQEEAFKSVDYSTAEFVYASEFDKPLLKKSWLEESTEVEFEKTKMMVPMYWHEVLSTFYGDYMELPPIEYRQAYHATQNIFLRSSCIEA